MSVNIEAIELKEGDLPKEYMTHLYERNKDHKEPIAGNVTINIQDEIEKIIGYAGRLLSASKSWYHEQYPDHRVFFNACIFDKKDRQVWFGDLDLTTDGDKLQEVANKVGKIYVTREHPFRWDGIKKHKKDSYYKDSIVIFQPPKKRRQLSPDFP